MSVLLRFVALYALMYAAFGVSSPFMPPFFKERGLTPEQLGLLFGAGTAIRLASGPLVGRLADLTQALRTALAGCEAQAAIVAVGLLWPSSFTPLLLISLVPAAALAPTTALADALALSAAQPRERPRFEYGWVRGTGSAFFVIGTLASGQLVEDRGLASIIVFQAALLAGAAGAATLLPKPESSPRKAVTDRAPPSGVVTLLALLILVSGRLYGALNARGFLVMALLCAAVPPLAWRLYAVDARVNSGQR